MEASSLSMSLLLLPMLLLLRPMLLALRPRVSRSPPLVVSSGVWPYLVLLGSSLASERRMRNQAELVRLLAPPAASAAALRVLLPLRQPLSEPAALPRLA
jgi:hypothetical protein